MNGRLRRPVRLLVAALAIHALPVSAAAQEARFDLALAEPLPVRPTLSSVADSLFAPAAVRFDTTAIDAAALPVRPLAVLLAGGLIAGTAGYLGGAYAADQVYDCTPGCTGPAYTSASIGMSVLLPVGIHFASGRQGDLRKSMLVSSAIAMVGYGIMKSGMIKPDVIHLVVPVAQITTLLSIR